MYRGKLKRVEIDLERERGKNAALNKAYDVRCEELRQCQLKMKALNDRIVSLKNTHSLQQQKQERPFLNSERFRSNAEIQVMLSTLEKNVSAATSRVKVFSSYMLNTRISVSNLNRIFEDMHGTFQRHEMNAKMSAEERRNFDAENKRLKCELEISRNVNASGNASQMRSNAYIRDLKKRILLQNDAIAQYEARCVVGEKKVVEANEVLRRLRMCYGNATTPISAP
eukprot:g3159.t1